jgi:molybdopterin converting factor subunit 1
MRVTVRLFARLRDLAGAGELTREIDAPATIATVWRDLVAEVPDLAAYADTMSVARNLEHARMDSTVSDGDEIAFLPPVSGGASCNSPGAGSDD